AHDAAVAAAGLAGLRLRARLRAAAAALLARVRPRDLERLLDSGRDLLQRELEVDAQARAAPAAALARAAEELLEEAAAAEQVAEARQDLVHAPEAGRGAVGLADAGVSELVVLRALARVGQHRVGLGGLLEALLRRRITRTAVRMVLHGQLAIG